VKGNFTYLFFLLAYVVSIHNLATTSISLVLSECSNLDEITEAITDYQGKKEKYAIRRDAVNGLGFQFIQNKKTEMGFAVLEFNAEEFPQSPWSLRVLVKPIR
jgi:hypothetical protein